MSNISQLIRERSDHLELLDAVGALGERLNVKPFLVGGYLRDLIMDRPSKDIDLMVEGDGIAFARALAREMGVTSDVVAYEKFGTALIPFDEKQVEVATARTEQYDSNSRKPIVKSGTVLEDMSRRDFTVNAFAISLSQEDFGDLVDPFHGIAHMQQKILRTPLEPDMTFSDDPLRMLRAARFAAQLEFEIVPECLESIKGQSARMSIISKERITEEMMKMLSARQPSIGLKILQDTGLLPFVMPELDGMAGVDVIKGRGHKDVFYHTLEVVDNAAALSPKMELRFAALVHDIGKPATKYYDRQRGWTFHHHEEVGRKLVLRMAKRMKLSNDLRDYLSKLTRLHLRPITLAQSGITDSAVRRVMREAGDDIDDLMILCRADVTTKKEAKIAKYMGNFERVELMMQDVTMRDEMKAFQSPVRGEEIMSICGIKPGRKVGELKSAIEEAILAGEIANEYDPALAYLHQIKDEILGK